MFQYREVLVRLRQGDTDREIARSGLMGRRKVAAFRYRCEQEGWLDPATPLPEDAELAASVGAAKRACSTISSVEPYRAAVQRWVEQGVNAVAIHAALSREHGYRGSYSSVYRHGDGDRRDARAGGDRAAVLRAGGGGAGGFRRRSIDARSGSAACAADLVLCDD